MCRPRCRARAHHEAEPASTSRPPDRAARTPRRHLARARRPRRGADRVGRPGHLVHRHGPARHRRRPRRQLDALPRRRRLQARGQGQRRPDRPGDDGVLLGLHALRAPGRAADPALLHGDGDPGERLGDAHRRGGQHDLGHLLRPPAPGARQPDRHRDRPHPDAEGAVGLQHARHRGRPAAARAAQRGRQRRPDIRQRRHRVPQHRAQRVCDPGAPGSVGHPRRGAQCGRRRTRERHRADRGHQLVRRRRAVCPRDRRRGRPGAPPRPGLPARAPFDQRRPDPAARVEAVAHRRTGDGHRGPRAERRRGCSSSPTCG